MIVNNGEIANIPRLSPERPQQSRDIDRATVITSDSSATNAPVPVNDQIALSLATKFLQKATNAGEDVRLSQLSLCLKPILFSRSIAVRLPKRIGECCYFIMRRHRRARVIGYVSFPTFKTPSFFLSYVNGQNKGRLHSYAAST